MRQKKTRVELYSLYDHTGIAAHLEQMAAKGWLLEKIGNFGWRYRRCEPKQLRFAVTYFPKASIYDAAPSEGEQTFRAYCEQAGWQLAAANAQLQIFYHEDPDCTPLETDALTQVENVHEAGKKTFLMTNWVYLGLSVLQLVTLLGSHLSRPLEIFTQTTVPFAAMIWLLQGVLGIVELTTYYRWRKKALRLAEETDAFLPTKSHPGFQLFILLLVTAGYLIWIGSMSSNMALYTGIMLVCILIFHLVVNGTRLLLKKLRFSTTANRTITIAVDVVLAFALIFGMTSWVVNSGFGQRKPVDTYEYLGREREVYADELPLYVDELMDCDRSDYSSEIVQNHRGLFGWAFIGFQNGRKDRDGDLPGIWYYVVEIENDWAFEKCWEDRLDAYGGVTTKEEMTDPWSSGLVAEDPVPWHAEMVYAQYLDQNFTGSRLIRWEDRFAWLELDWDPTPEQMAAIAEALSQFQP